MKLRGRKGADTCLAVQRRLSRLARAAQQREVLPAAITYSKAKKWASNLRYSSWSALYQSNVVAPPSPSCVSLLSWSSGVVRGSSRRLPRGPG